jgi:hypothetical protein
MLLPLIIFLSYPVSAAAVQAGSLHCWHWQPAVAARPAAGRLPRSDLPLWQPRQRLCAWHAEPGMPQVVMPRNQVGCTAGQVLQLAAATQGSLLAAG